MIDHINLTGMKSLTNNEFSYMYNNLVDQINSELKEVRTITNKRVVADKGSSI